MRVFPFVSLLVVSSSLLGAQTVPQPLVVASAPNSATTLPTELPLPGQPYPILQITVEHPILLITDATPTPSTQITYQGLNFPPRSKLTAEWTQVQDVISPTAAKMSDCPIVLNIPTGKPSITATFPAPGVYEIRLVVRDTTHNLTATQNTWINVWDSYSHIMVNGKPDPLCPAPGINPPNVRTLTPDPGPFRHPRLYTTDRDWSEVSDRCAHGKIASYAVKKLREEIADSIDSATSDFGKLTTQLEAYADSHYKDKEPDLTLGIPPDINEKDNSKNWDKVYHNLMDYHDCLKKACLLAWLGQDPSVAHAEVSTDKQKRFRQLAKVTAAVAHIQFVNSFDVASGSFHKDYPLYIHHLEDLGNGFDDFSNLALAYDFIASWMTSEEQLETRNLLFAACTGRTTGARLVFFASGIHGRILRGMEQNGDFMNIEEAKILSSLAIEGEEGTVPEKIRQTFTELPEPKLDDFQRKEDFYAFDWVHYTFFDGPRQQEGSRPYPDACSWPFARKVEVDNLKRAQWWNDDWFVTPWGMQLNHEAYYGFSAWGLWPAAVAYARHGAENQFIAANYYVTLNHLLWCSYGFEGYQKVDEFSPNRAMYDHHDGGGDYRQNHILIMKYMYPDDPAVDYCYSSDAVPSIDPTNPRPGINFNPFLDALFALEPGVNGKPNIDLATVAQQKDLPLTKVDPQEGVVIARSDWTENAMELYFDEAWPGSGHMHAEKGNFSFYALNRPWSMPPGYHVTESGYQSEVLIQDSRFASDPKNQGYFGEGPNINLENNPDYDKAYPHCFPTPPGHLYPVEQSKDKLFLMMAGENTVAYSYCCGDGAVDTGLPLTQFMYPGIYQDLIKRLPSNVGFKDSLLHLRPDYNPVKYAYRTILFTRGDHPYVLIMDDINKNDKPQNYRWQMNCSVIFGGPGTIMVDKEGHGLNSDLDILPNSTSTEAVLYHTPFDEPPKNDPNAKGLPRLLVRELSEVPSTDNTPPIEVNKQPLGDNPTAIHRAYIYKNQVADPHFKVLLFPYRTGDDLPDTKWNRDHSQLTIDLGDGHRDVIAFDRSNPDHRTRIVSALRYSQ